jgi:hypothetical protein
MWYLVPYDILCHYGNFLNDTSCEYVNQILSWMIEIWMKYHIHLVSGSNYNIVNL